LDNFPPFVHVRTDGCSKAATNNNRIANVFLLLPYSSSKTRIHFTHFVGGETALILCSTSMTD